MNDLPACSVWSVEEDAPPHPLGLIVLLLGVMGLSLLLLLGVTLQSQLLVVSSVAAVSPDHTRELVHLRQENARLRDQLGLDRTANLGQLEQAQQSLAQSEQQRDAALTWARTIHQRLQELLQARALLLTEVQQRLAVEGIETRVDETTGRVQFPGTLVFHSGASILPDRHQPTVQHLAEVLTRIFVCQTPVPSFLQIGCSPALVGLDGVLVEGHSDNVPVQHSLHRDNWSLSASRAAHVLNRLLMAQPDLGDYRNAGGDPLLRIGGHGDRLPVDENGEEYGRRHNRRVELRFTLAWPNLERFQELPVASQGE